MSSQGAAGNPLQGPKVLLGSRNGAQGSPEELPRGLEELKRRSEDQKTSMFTKPYENQWKSLIFPHPKASWEHRFASKRVLGSDVQALEVYGCTKSRSGEPQEAPVEASRGSCEVPWRCFGSSWRSKKLPKPRSSIHSSVSEPPRTLPEVPKSRFSGPVGVLEPPEGGQVSSSFG